MTDPWLSYYGQPILPAGYNADDNDGDDVNGAGTNWPIWPVLFDTFEALNIIIVTEEMMAVFDTTCPDYAVRGENNVITLPMENQYLEARNIWGALDLTTTSNVIVIPAEQRGLAIRSESDTAVLTKPEQAYPVRRKK